MAILYPNIKILVVCPVKSQSKQFVKKIYEYMRMSKNLEQEIKTDEIKIGVNECQIPFKNGSVIFTATYSENALGRMDARLYSNIQNELELNSGKPKS